MPKNRRSGRITARQHFIFIFRVVASYSFFQGSGNNLESNRWLEGVRIQRQSDGEQRRSQSDFSHGFPWLWDLLSVIPQHSSFFTSRRATAYAKNSHQKGCSS
jgi:hypothetical protein